MGGAEGITAGSEPRYVWTKGHVIIYNYTNTQMIKGGRDMANMFEKYASDREAEKGTTLSLSLTVSDKKALKMMAAERETTIAAIIHEWVMEHMQEVSG